MEFDQEVSQAIAALRRERGLGVSEAVNELIHRGLVVEPARPPFRQRTAALRLSVDVSSVADALEVLDGAATR